MKVLNGKKHLSATSTKQYQDILSQGPWLLLRIQEDFTISEIMGQELSNFPFRENEWKDISARIIFEEAPDFIEAIQLCLESQKIVTGDLQWAGLVYSTRINPVLGKHGLEVLVLCLDVSSQKKMEGMLRENEERFRRLAEVASEGIAILEEGRIVDANPSLSRCFGYPLYQILGTNFLDLVHKEDEEKLKAALEVADEGQLEIRFNRSDDESFPAELGIKPLTEVSVPTLVVALRDISSKIEARNAIQEKQDELEKINLRLRATNEELTRTYEDLKKATENRKQIEQQLIQAEKSASLGMMAAGIAHEISQPLNALKIKIDGMEYWLDKGKSLDSPTVRDKLAKASTHIEKITEIVQHTRSLYQDQDLPELKQVNLNERIEEALSLVRSQLKKTGVQLKVELSPSLPPVNAHPIQVEQVVLNLLQNSRQALQTVNKSEAWIRIQTKTHRKTVQILVEDNGPGIKNIDHIFDPFYSGEAPGAMGLGLSVVNNCVQSWGGKIKVENRKENGARFLIELPVK